MDIHGEASVYLDSFLNGSVRSILFRGPPGIGKSTIVVNSLMKSDIPNDLIIVKSGYETMTSIFDHLEDIQDQLAKKYDVELCDLVKVLEQKVCIVFDDVSVLHSPDFKDQALLKSLWDDRPEVVTTYRTQNRHTIIYNDIFKFIVIMNGSVAGQSIHRKAIDDRMLVYEYHLDVESMLRFAVSLYIPNVNTFERRAFFETFFKTLKSELVGSGVKSFSIRQFKKILMLIDWREEMIAPILNIEFPINEDYSSFLEIINDNSLKDVGSQIIEFERRTTLKKRTFHYYKKRYNSLIKLNKIELSDFYSQGTHCVNSEYEVEMNNSCNN